MKYDIYFIKCIKNDKVYVGRSQEVEKRWRSHKNELKRDRHSNKNLQLDWLLYGEDNFKFNIIDTCYDINEAIILEQKYIDNISNKYNISDAKNGGDTFTNNPRKEEIRKLKSNIFSGRNNPMYGKPKSKLMIDRVKEANSKKVYINGIVYKSLTEASKSLNIKLTTLQARIKNEKSELFKNYYYLN